MIFVVVPGAGDPGVRDAALPDLVPPQQGGAAQHAGHGHALHVPLPRVDQRTQANQLRQVEDRNHALQGKTHKSAGETGSF